MTIGFVAPWRRSTISNACSEPDADLDERVRTFQALRMLELLADESGLDRPVREVVRARLDRTLA